MHTEAKPLRILHVSEPTRDGVFRYVNILIRNQLNSGHTVHFAYSSTRSSPDLADLLQTIRDAKGRTVDLQVHNRPGLRDFSALRTLHTLTKDVDIIHAHSSKAGALSRMLPVRVPVVYTPNAYFGMGQRQGLFKHLFDGVEHLLSERGLTIHVSEDEARYARTVLKVPTHGPIIHNPVDTSQFRKPSKTQRRKARQFFGIPEDAQVIGSLGRLTFQKHPELLYQSFRACLQDNPQVYLLHIGEGEQMDAIRTWIRDHRLGHRICALPALTNPQNFYWACDLFTLTSRYEGFSLAAVEALCCGLPLVFVDAPGTRALLNIPLKHAQMRATEPCPACLASAFTHTLKAKREEREVQKAAREAGTLFAATHCARKIEAVYRQLQKKSPADKPQS